VTLESKQAPSSLFNLHSCTQTPLGEHNLNIDTRRRLKPANRHQKTDLGEEAEDAVDDAVESASSSVSKVGVDGQGSVQKYCLRVGRATRVGWAVFICTCARMQTDDDHEGGSRYPARSRREPQRLTTDLVQVRSRRRRAQSEEDCSDEVLTW
jgi:hypothetical protein